MEYPDPGTYMYSATRGSVSLIELPDGTKVWLNSDSKLTFSEDHKTNNALPNSPAKPISKLRTEMNSR